MKILHLTSGSGFYGAEKVLLDIARISKDNQFEPYLVCIKGIGRPDPEICLQAQKQGLPSRVVSCRNKFDLSAVKEIGVVIKKEGIKVLHSHGYKSNIYGLLASRIFKVPIVATIHGWTGETVKLRLYEALDRWIIRNMNHLVPVSSAICKELAALKLNGSGMTLIPNGVDTDKFNPDKVGNNAGKKFGLSESLVIGYVGRLSKEKGPDYLIEAFKKVRLKIPNAKLLMVGDGPLGDSLKLTVSGLGLEKDVIFTGARDDVALLYKKMDILVMPSLTEGTPIALLEAMSMEKPVIASNVGGVPHVIDQEKNGILIEPCNCDILAEKMRLLLEDSSLRIRLGKAARGKVVENFSNRSLYQNYLKVYKHVKRSDN